MKINEIAVTGYNGNKDAAINSSSQVGFSIYDSNLNEILIYNATKPIKIQIPINSSVVKTDFIKYETNATNMLLNNLTKNFSSNSLLINKIKISSSNNPAIFIHIKPSNINSTGYVLLVKYGVKLTFSSYDEFKVFCPKDDLISQMNETFYYFFSNETKFQPFFSYGLRELTIIEYMLYCVNRNYTKNYFNPSATQLVLFTSNFWIRSFLAGCYFYNQTSGEWSNYGLSVTNNSNIKYTECLSGHLTDFAGGFIVVPSEIDFNYVWANASIMNNPTIYLTVIILSVIFIAVALFAKYLDVKDLNKIGLNLLVDNKLEDNYYYELIVFTGNRREAATDSVVRFKLSGDLAETNNRIFNHPDKEIFRRSGIDSFIMSVTEPLGGLNYIKIWHDSKFLAAWNIFIIP
jgi:hypothetical protein